MVDRRASSNDIMISINFSRIGTSSFLVGYTDYIKNKNFGNG